MVQSLLHGTLHATIYEVDKLQQQNGCFSFCRKDQPTAGRQNRGKKFLSQVKRLVLGRPEVIGSGIYATVDLDKARVARTRMVKNESSNPTWNESFNIYCAHYITNVVFTIKLNDPIGATLIGRSYISVQELLNEYIVDKWLDITNENNVPVAGNSRIHVRLQFFSVSQDSSWSNGIPNPNFNGIPHAFFNQRDGCKVTLYQDAHVNDNFRPWMNLAGKPYEPRRCWEDIFDAITKAQHFIYITGWSVYTKIRLVRDPKRPKLKGDIPLGELLIMKAEEGVKVLVLVWDDRTSVKELKKDGLMATHDQETEEYFRNTKVHCLLCPRNPGGGRSRVQGFEVSAMFTHHQKTIIVDSEVLGGELSHKRRIVSFVGGIDLCDGRYDTQEHSVFSTLDTIHHDDFHQPNFPGSTIEKGGPREPWHDIHCKIEGPAAWDVLYNFEQRWLKQIGKQWLIPKPELDAIITKPLPVTHINDTETWNVQIFRSIDGSAAINFPEKPEVAAQMGLVTGKDNIFDRSIQDAYINAIRRAKHFIYIENQYFLGSSFGWKSTDINDADIGALHLIPKEISLKIVSKIEANERFTAYIVIPMWPEGIPESSSVQAILDWQRRTIEMMYDDVVQALHKKGLNTNPREYLSFFCLGNREMKKHGEYVPSQAPDPDTDYIRAQESRRFMIYVHAKTMIVDDEYIIVGSANINQRSMDGSRDSEIAMGGYQPHHLSTTHPARGDIFRFRMALWYEHLRLLEDSFLKPESVECVQTVNAVADAQWDMYASDILHKDLPGHLLRYPIEIAIGGITSLTGFRNFPDTKASILGNGSVYLPPILTT